MSQWKAEEEAYLRDLSRACVELATRYKEKYDVYRRYQARFRIPSIIVSSALGLLSFGNQNFEDGRSINIVVGVGTVMIAIANSVETYMKIGEHMAGCLLASANLQKLNESICLELALPVEDRSLNGLIFLRDAYNAYERHVDAAPAVLKRVRFVRAPVSFFVA